MIPVKNIRDIQISPNWVFGNEEATLYDVHLQFKLTPDGLGDLSNALRDLGWIK